MTEPDNTIYPRPRPLIGDASSASERSAAPDSWAFDAQAIQTLDEIISARRDIRRFRPEPVPEELVRLVIESGHKGPSVGHSQPWRFIIVSDDQAREAAAVMADAQRITQATAMTDDRGQRLLDLKLEGLREAPLGIVVACDRRTPALGVLGRASFTGADMWSCACAIENMWLTARAHGLGMGWVTLFDPGELHDLLGLPEGVETLGWLCLGWPDELPPEPGLQRLAWSKRLPLDEVILHDRWPREAAPAQPLNHLRAPGQAQVVSATDDADELLSPAGSLGVLDRCLDRIVAAGGSSIDSGRLVLVGADHPVFAHGVSAFAQHVTRDVMTASVAGTSYGVLSANGAGLDAEVVDAGVAGGLIPGAINARCIDGSQGDLVNTDALTREETSRLVDIGRETGERAADRGLVVLGEVGIGNTTVAACLASALIGLDPEQAVGLGAGSDYDMVDQKVGVVNRALGRAEINRNDPIGLLSQLGGPEFAVLTGVVLGAAGRRAPIILDGYATSICALLAQTAEPGVHGFLIAGQRSREVAHAEILRVLGLEPLLALRMRAGEGVGGAMAASLLLQGLRIRRMAARTA
ncbi:nicotinate-nucleotide-dimethylbenzimidazole phosphoribosyltransferase [Propionibacterium sp. oral taxon 192 str. F0372]|uniref:5,6-dimethylbenzimidazole synthase n=1 Tax=Propionibacterium sp. oral taxon 192 TaxID=671222 RepID=UPI000353ED5A|nr:5,6-dimethylbenzimidazole synthase [Propionibacterium sp. oral taxon 192]EPH06968.1 nicotinate-nucleotide-dimethylbenzimidazole phosphoribosyltransferase [Propionibacterium sp. oral taxon 192 str. F0372]